jgi:hypothetical protein
MSKPIIAGQKHVSEKKSSSSPQTKFKPRTQLDIPEWALKDIESQGMEARWLDALQMQENGNMHRNHWQVYRRDTSKVGPTGANAWGLPPDGTVRSGTCILGCRPTEIADAHREDLRQKAKRMTAAVKGQGAELRRMIQQAGIDGSATDETEIS